MLFVKMTTERNSVLDSQSKPPSSLIQQTLLVLLLSIAALNHELFSLEYVYVVWVWVGGWGGLIQPSLLVLSV